MEIKNDESSKKSQSRISIISYDIIGKNMAGPGIRFYEFAKILSEYLDVTLLTPNKIDIDTEGFKTRQYKINKNNINILKLQLTIGDFFICASEKQRDYWIGMLSAVGRLNPYNYDSDSTLRKLIDVVPFGTPSEPPAR